VRRIHGPGRWGDSPWDHPPHKLRTPADCETLGDSKSTRVIDSGQADPTRGSR